MSELLPNAWIDLLRHTSSPIIVELGQAHTLSILLRCGRHIKALTTTDARHLASLRPTILRVPSNLALKKKHMMPAASHRDLNQALHHELERITPFKAEELFWRWDKEPAVSDKTRANITLTMVPIKAIAHALETLAGIGLNPSYVEVGLTNHRSLLRPGDRSERTVNYRSFHVVAGTCVALGLIALILPSLLQGCALTAVNDAIEQLQPTVDQVGTLRNQLAATKSEQAMVNAEIARGDTLIRSLELITRDLPDGTYLDEFSLQDRAIVLRGRSPMAARLIATLSDDPAIRTAAFIAPVTHAAGSADELFSISLALAR